LFRVSRFHHRAPLKNKNKTLSAHSGAPADDFDFRFPIRISDLGLRPPRSEKKSHF
jgi:hypothetical protein